MAAISGLTSSNAPTATSRLHERRWFGLSGKRCARNSGRRSSKRIANKPSHNVNPEAYSLYILGQRALDRRNQSIRASVDMFRRATRLDTLFANAYSGLSMALALTPYFQSTPASEVFDEAITSAEFALHLDPTLAQPHIALGMIYQTVYEWDRAGRHLRIAVDTDPHDVEARMQYGRFLLIRDSVRAALVQFRAARSEDPASGLVASWVSYAFYLDGQLDSAFIENDRAFRSDSTGRTTLGFGSELHLGRGRHCKGASVGRPSGTEQPGRALCARRDSRHRDRHGHVAREGAQPPRPWMTETARAFVMLGLGDTMVTMDALERANAAKESWSSKLPMRDPILDPVRGSARFRDLVRTASASGKPSGAAAHPSALTALATPIRRATTQAPPANRPSARPATPSKR